MKNRFKWDSFVTIYILILEIITLLIITHFFLGFSMIMSIAKQVSVNGIVSVGMIFVLISKGMDLSVGSQMALSGMLCAWFMTNLSINPLLAALLCIILCVFMSMINGYIASKLYIHPFIITMAVSVIYRGMTKTINNGMPIYNMPESFLSFTQISLWGVPFLVIILIFSVLIGEFILSKTYLGKYFYALGENEKVAELGGLNTRKIRIFAYSISGFFVGIASVITLSRIGSAQPDVAGGIEFDILAAAALGGISFKGGKGNLKNIIIALFIVEIFGVILIVLNVGDYYRSIIKGAILLIAIGTDKSSHRLK